MPRQAHGRPLQPGRVQGSTRRRPTKNRRLNALEIAEHENPESVKIRKHRLGVVEDDSDEPHSREGLDEPTSKRRRVTTNDEDESADEGSDLEGNRWHVGVDDEDEDSDIDSEDAFGASDEERFADFAFRGSTSATAPPKKKRSRSVADDLDENERDDDNENENEESDDLGDDAIDLATAWDMDDESGSDVAGKKRKGHHARPGSDDEHEENSESDDDEDEDADGESEDEDDQKSLFSLSDDDGDHSRLQSFVEGLSSDRSVTATRKQRLPSNLPDKPSQFGTSGSKISAADLMQYIKDPRQRQSLKILQNNDEQGNEVYKGGIPGGKLAPPLAKRHQDRLDRAAAYDETKKELGKWVETVKQNRRAEHLSFPLVDPAASGELTSKQLGPTSKSQPMTALESTIQDIMKESGMLSKEQRSLDEQEQAYEELQEKKLPLEEVQARRAELRKARDLMFREEIRARRIKKIKSKSYRRVHRKEREKAELEHRSLLAAQGLIDSDEDREKNDRRRAEERMGARHRESKWAKSTKATGRAAWDENTRHSVTDLARRDEELRRRIEGKTVGDSVEDEIESSESDEYSDSEDERSRLENKIDSLNHDTPASVESRLNNMAFMKKAEASRKAANDEELRRLQRSLQDDGEHGGSEDSEADREEPKGRRRFGGQGTAEMPQIQPPVQKSEFEEYESDAEREDVENAEEQMGHASKGRLSNSATAPLNSTQPRLPATTRQSKAANQAAPSGPVVAKSNSPRRAQKEVAMPRKQTGVSHIDLDGYTSPSESENEQDDHAALANAIFAGPDEVEQDFAKEKKEVEEEEGDQVIDNGLPGWGSWAGEGISKKAQKRSKGRLVTTVKGVSKDKRQDAKLDRVIINEKRVKRNGKYLATELPHPFESRQQYERSLRLPLGPEWTTKSTFQDATKPRVLMKQGIIRPMARPMVE